MLYQFKTSATMKPYNNKKWWIDSGIIREITTEAATMGEALKQYQKAVHDNYYIDISYVHNNYSYKFYNCAIAFHKHLIQNTLICQLDQIDYLEYLKTMLFH